MARLGYERTLYESALPLSELIGQTNQPKGTFLVFKTCTLRIPNQPDHGFEARFITFILHLISFAKKYLLKGLI